ncbi:PREDICTED: synaptonemal complex protein 1 isoform X2 [Camelina sativa]|uniref:Synaptonemal complex protein 1 isoform X2 n=1 Tax=Camelina sativa TaxID=90675 RepID=A0ABM0VR82_CAMSA|nr:PREDICTED: synaptonemal complex protein 1 isoform X2 [Camelina sativa]
MQKLGFPAMKSFDQLRSMSGSAKTHSFSTRPPQDSVSSGSFSNLKLTAEKLVKDQAAMRTDLELANCKLKKSMEHVYALEDKLQNAFNENAKLRVRQKEDEKLWRGLESKFSSTKALCDQLTETLQHLASQVQDAEKEKDFFESKFNTSSEAIDSLNQQMQDMSLRLDAAKENITSRDKELEEFKLEKEQKEMLYLNEQCRTASLIEKKDDVITKLEATAAERKLNIDNLNSQIEKLHLEVTTKEHEVKDLVSIQEKLEREKTSVQLSADKLFEKLVSSEQEVKKLDEFVHCLVAEMTKLDKKNLTFMEKFDKLSGLYDTHFMLLQKDRDLASDRAQRSFDQLQGKLFSVTAQKEALQSAGKELNGKMVELQNDKESLISQLSGVRCSASQTIDKLESEAKELVLKNAETESVILKLKEEIETLLGSLKTSEDKKQELSLKISSLEMENKEKCEKLQADAQRQVEELETLQKESESHQLQADLLAKEVNELQTVIEEKGRLIHQCNEDEKKLNQQIIKDKELLVTAETNLVEAKKQYDMMLESKQLELSRHLKELSQRNDQAINDIRRKYDVEKQEIINAEKDKVEKMIKELSTKYDKELSDCKEESKRQLLTIQEEHASLSLSIREEHGSKELNLKAKYDQELRQNQIQAENELKERITALKSEHDAQLKAFKCQYEDDCKKLQEELDLQRKKEERQRALVQLQWKVMSDNPPEEQEVNSNKNYSISKDSRLGGSKRSEHIRVRADNNDEQDSPFVKAKETPVPKILKKAQHVNTGSVLSIPNPKHHSRGTHRDYEVGTNNGRITKRRKTKNTAIEEPQRRRTRATPKLTPQSVAKGAVRTGHLGSANIGDLFSEGSLNPYADDPYAFD